MTLPRWFRRPLRSRPRSSAGGERSHSARASPARGRSPEFPQGIGADTSACASHVVERKICVPQPLLYLAPLYSPRSHFSSASFSANAKRSLGRGGSGGAA